MQVVSCQNSNGIGVWRLRELRERSVTGSQRWQLQCLWLLHRTTLTCNWSNLVHTPSPTLGMAGVHSFGTYYMPVSLSM